MIRLFDGHCDTAYELWRRGQPLAENPCHIDLRKASAFGAYAQVFAFCSYAGTAGVNCEAMLTEPLSVLRGQVSANAAHIAFADTRETIVQALSAGKTAALLSVEGAEVLACDPHRLYALRSQGFRMLTLTWNADNALAGCHLSGSGSCKIIGGKDRRHDLHFFRSVRALWLVLSAAGQRHQRTAQQYDPFFQCAGSFSN